MPPAKVRHLTVLLGLLFVLGVLALTSLTVPPLRAGASAPSVPMLLLGWLGVVVNGLAWQGLDKQRAWGFLAAYAVLLETAVTGAWTRNGLSLVLAVWMGALLLHPTSRAFARSLQGRTAALPTSVGPLL